MLEDYSPDNRFPHANGDRPHDGNGRDPELSLPKTDKHMERLRRRRTMLGAIGLLYPSSPFIPTLEKAAKLFAPASGIIASLGFLKPSAINRWMELRTQMAAERTSRKSAHEIYESRGEPGEMIEYSNHLYTHTGDTLHHITSEDIAPYFKGDADEWPILSLTTNHAMTDGTDDVTEIMHCFETFHRNLLAKHSGRLELIRHMDKNGKGGKGKMLLASAIHTYPSFEENAASVMYRHRYLCECNQRSDISLKERLFPSKNNPIPCQYAEEEEMRRISPASVRLGKLMLKLMLENPAKLEVDALNCGERHPFVDEVQPLIDLDPAETPVLRADAARIADHFLLNGYSMGARNVQEAVDYLILELTSKHGDGTSLFHQRRGDGSITPVSDVDIRNIIRKILIFGVNGPALPLTPEERQYEMQRVLVNNKNDLVSYHFLISSDMWRNVPTRLKHPDQNRDRVHVIDGGDDLFGHSPIEALCAAPRMHLQRGYILDNPAAMKGIEAALHHKFGLVHAYGHGRAA